jgi:hypothetical protein
MAQITKRLALAIVKKLGANLEAKRSHDYAKVYHNGKLIALFGIRRGSSVEQGHDHIPSALNISPHQARLLGQCPLSKQEWLDILSGKGFI